ncbi:MAG: TIR domain-containing protein [Phycisphaerales bacterium]|nr:TIR domain-containing protein [Phycisphaerales bacterium]
MARRVFYSFHYHPDNWRASQVRNIGAIEGNRPATDNDWESIVRAGEDRIKRWIADQMDGTSCTVVLIGAETAGRKWINHEIIKAWNDRKGVVGVYVHNLLDGSGLRSSKGQNPFDSIRLGDNGPPLSSVVKAYDPSGWDSKDVYATISNSLSGWIDEAISIRGNR